MTTKEIPKHPIEELLELSTRGRVANRGVGLLMLKMKYTFIIACGSFVLFLSFLTLKDPLIIALVAGSLAYGLRGMKATESDFESFRKRYVLIGKANEK